MAATFQRITLSGFDPHHILTAKASLDDARYQEAAAFQNLLAKGVTAMQRALAKADSNLPMSGFYSMEQILAEQLQKQRVEVLLLATLAGSAFVSLWGPRFSKQCCT